MYLLWKTSVYGCFDLIRVFKSEEAAVQEAIELAGTEHYTAKDYRINFVPSEDD